MTVLRLTYRELAERTGRTPEGARMLARNHYWQVARGNDGKARVTVEETDLEMIGQPPGRPDGHPAGDLVVAQVVNPLVDELRTERDRARGDADALRLDTVKLRERVARLEGEAAGVRATAVADVATAQAEVIAKDQVIAELREQLAWHRQPFWRRWLAR